jgi:hypothetical protein
MWVAVVSGPLDDFLAYAVDTCVNPRPVERPCPDCYGAGRVELPVVREVRGRYRVVGSRWEICMGCLGSGVESGAVNRKERR